MNFKRFSTSDNQWHDVPYCIHNTATDTITTLPAVLYPNAVTATVGLKGNTTQSGAPTHDNPIQPQETGERTGNLWNAEGFSARAITSTHEHSNTNPYGTTLSSTTGKEVSITQANYPTGNVGYQNGFFTIDIDFSKYAVGDVVTISFDYIVNEIHSLSTQKYTSVYAGKDSNAVPYTLSSGDWKNSGRLTAKITIIADMRPYVEVRLCGNSITVKNIMLNTGSTALPYEPYGYKIPILSANTTTPVYLGEVETTRKIKKLVLTGEESITKTWVISNCYYISVSDYLYERGMKIAICTHYKSQTNVNGAAEMIDKRLSFYANKGNISHIMYIRDTSFATKEDLASYLTAQYAAGTPVTVWYVLATETTGIVNEPLRKIGDYADEVSGITIPTIAGADTLSIGTTLQPSEVTATYKGWHPVQSVHERENGQWD